MQCPFSLEYEEEEDALVDKDQEQMEKKKDVDPEVFSFEVVTKKPPQSEFDEEVAAKQKADREIRERMRMTIDDDEPDYEKDDEYGRTRLHAWVLIQTGTRDVVEPIFIEPTTGRKYSIDNAPYHSIECIFNHQNFWVNLDPSREIDDVNLDFQEDVTGEWEYVMIQKGKAKDGDDENEDEEEMDDDEDEEEMEEEVLDMPPPWSPKLFVNKDKFADGCPNGEKTVFYKKCKVDFYSECKQVDGLVKRITIYEDFKRLITKEIRSYYKNRMDKLVVRRRFPYEFKLIEHYESSVKTQHWKKLE